MENSVHAPSTSRPPSWVSVAAYGSGNNLKPLPLQAAIVGKGGLILPCATKYRLLACGSRPIGRAPAQGLRAHTASRGRESSRQLEF
jgi:hypothetical protein